MPGPACAPTFFRLGVEVMGAGVLRSAGGMLLAMWLGLVILTPAAPAPSLESHISAASHLPGPPGDEGAGLSPGPAPLVYLTFDDGPHPVNTPRILEVLAAHGVRGTFFVVGSMVERWPETARRIVEAGHSIQLHSWGHGNLTRFTHEEFIRDTTLTQSVLAEVVDRRSTCLRPPYGAVNDTLEEWAEEAGLKVVLWTVAGADWLDISGQAVARRVLDGVSPGAVVLLHDGGGPRDRTVAALEIILPELSRAGYRVRPMCSSLPVTEPVRVCWGFYAWPEARPCKEDRRSPET